MTSMSPDGPLSPQIAGASAGRLYGHSIFTFGRQQSYGAIDPATGLPTGYQPPSYMARPSGGIVGPSLDAPKAPPVDLAALLNGKIEANARITFDQPAPVAVDVRVTADPMLKATVDAAKQIQLRAHSADTGVSMPEASPNGRRGDAE